ncbi:hypothetical protein BS78_05G077100 [Paspalum vaginatum]|nr:hypothetical protein BS78_05G077100 [Paspalum vaginatum]
MPGSNDGDSVAASLVSDATTSDQKLDHILKAVTDLTTKFTDLSTHVTDLEGRASSSSTFPPNPRDFPFGLPGYGGIPLPATTTTPTSAALASAQPPPTATPSAPPSAPLLPIHQIPFPHSPSPIPSLPPPSQPSLPSLPLPPPSLPPPPHQFEQPSHSATSSGVPRYHKLEFPAFDGKQDPLGWLNQCEQFFRGQRTLESDKVWLASYHLTGVARNWFVMVERDHPALSWQQFKDICNERFGPPLRHNPLGELARLQFRTTVEEYQERFCALLCHVAPLAPLQQVQLFTAGLPDRIRIDVELLNPPDLQQALRLARAYERRSQSLDVLAHPAPRRATKPMARAATPTLPLPSPPSTQTATPSAPAAAPPRPFKRLTPDEMAERRRQGLCYNCDEQYVRGHRCPRLFYLEVADFDEEDQPATTEDDRDDAEPVVSLHALTGIHTEDTMQLRVFIHGHELLALLDTGSTHNFITCVAARRIGLALEPTPGRHVKVANGDPVFCQGRTYGAATNIGDEVFPIDAYAIPLDTFDVILGVEFLRTLGPILWDFNDRCMAFWRRGRRVLWKGLGSSRTDIAASAMRAVSTDPAPMLDRLLHTFEDVFKEPQTVPPARSCDHHIHLKPGAAPVAVRPYRYPQL